MPGKFEEKFLSTTFNEKTSASISKTEYFTSGVQNMRPTFRAHLRSVLAKSAFAFVYRRPAASPTKNDSALSGLNS